MWGFFLEVYVRRERQIRLYYSKSPPSTQSNRLPHFLTPSPPPSPAPLHQPSSFPKATPGRSTLPANTRSSIPSICPSTPRCAPIPLASITYRLTTRGPECQAARTRRTAAGPWRSAASARAQTAWWWRAGRSKRGRRLWQRRGSRPGARRRGRDRE